MWELENVRGGGGSAKRPGSVFLFHKAELKELFELLRGRDADKILTDEDCYDCDEVIPICDEEDGPVKNYDYYYNFLIDIEAVNEENLNEENLDEDEEWTPYRGEITEPTTTKTEDSVRIPPDTITPYEYYRLLFTEQMLVDIVTATNKFAMAVLAQLETDTPEWKQLDTAELTVFLGLLFYMGAVKMSRFKSYWEGYPFFYCPVPRIMSKARFLLIFRFLRFGSQNLISLIDHFNTTMHVLFTPGSNLTIYDSLDLYRDGIGIACLPGEIKLHTLTTRRGISVQVQHYRRGYDGERNVIDKIVKKLMSRYLNAGHHLYLDSHYASVKLAEYFMENGTNVTGRLCTHGKDYPRIVRKSKLEIDDCVYRFNRKGVCVSKWGGDSSDIMTMSTSHVSDIIEEGGGGRKLFEPDMRNEYYKYMSIMKEDRIPKHYICVLQKMRWYKKMGLHIFQLMLMNAYLLYKLHRKPSVVTFDNFRETILIQLLPEKPFLRMG